MAQETIDHGRDREAHLKDYYRILRKHRWLVAGLFVLTVLTVSVWTFVQTPIYQASATVLIEPEAAKVLNIQEVTSIGAPTQEYYRTQYEIMTSRPILQKVVETLNLKQREPAIGHAVDPAAALASRVSIEPKRNT